MAETDTNRKHSIGDVWARINVQSDQIAEIAKGQVSTDARLASLESKFDSGFRNLTHAIEGLSNTVHTPPPKPNIVGMISAAFLTGSAFVSFVILMTSHLNEKIEIYSTTMTAAIVELHDDGDAVDTEIYELSQRLAHIEGRHDMLINRIEAIDNIGSRLRLNEDRK